MKHEAGSDLNSEVFFSSCPRGLETLLADEVRSLGAHDIKTVGGGVQWQGNWQTCYRINLHSRLATRVLWLLTKRRYQNEEDIYRLALSLPWGQWMTSGQSIRVYVSAHHCPLKSLNFVTLKIKDAVCDHLRQHTGRRPDVDVSAPDIRIYAYLDTEEVSLYLDTSGEPLYKRGFKHSTVKAPLKENLAAGILLLSGWQPEKVLVDPMCGSGTFLLEAVMMALKIAPGLNRQFGLQKLRGFDAALWQSLQTEARQQRLPARQLSVYGSDIDPHELRSATDNLLAAELLSCVTLKQADILELAAPAEQGVMVCNPPYGQRLGERSELLDFYPRLGSALKKSWPGWYCCFLSADTELPHGLGLKARKKTPLFNGALECRLYQFQMIAGSMRHIRPDTENVV